MTESTRKLPIQKRSIEKRNYILRTGLNLIIQKGYHNTTTDDIAAAAGVSTGIIYRYFSDKKELLLAALDDFIASVEENFFQTDYEKSTENLSNILESILNKFIDLHLNYKQMHEEMESLSHFDADICHGYEKFSVLLFTYMQNALPDSLKELDHQEERIYMCMQYMENYCHLAIQDETLDLNFIKQLTLKQCCCLFN